MAILKPTDIMGKVEAILVNGDRGKGLESAPLPEVEVTFSGFAGESHGGLTRASCSRTLRQYPKGTIIRNVRQITILSVEEMDKIARAMGIDVLNPAWVGANLILSGIPDLTLLPPSSRLIFEGDVSLVIDMENQPCRYPGEVIDQHHPGKGRLFSKHAYGKRGITAWVERPGLLKKGEVCNVHMPPQRIYKHAKFHR